MRVSDFAIANPVKVTVGVILVCMFGLIALLGIPVQMTPEVTRPVVSVRTQWPGAGPQEIENDIVSKQEEQLQDIEGMIDFRSTCIDGRGEIVMEFAVGTDINSTMLKVAKYIVQAQMNWFEKGIAHLKPMVLQDVADAVEMHVSTISRVSNGKYMQTPHGVFELKYFFDSKVHRHDGEDVSARSVKERISSLIGAEDKAKPLSDQEIADVLSQEGLQIARRTVAKYRDQLRINPQRYRKKTF